MIKYKLICKECQNLFDSWFASSLEYEKLKKLKHLNCYFCNSKKVEKTLMSPSIVNLKGNIKIAPKHKKYIKIQKKIKEYKKFIKNNFEYVGNNFAYEARSINYKSKKKSKGIYGEATKDEVMELKEEGIEVDTIPWFNEKDN